MMTTLAEYQQGLEQFDRSGSKLWYLALGLVGEAGELLDKMAAQTWRSGDIEAVDGIFFELGDCMWYVGRLADMLSCSLEDLPMPAENAALDEMMTAVKVVSEACIVADKVKKVYRDEHWLTPEDMKIIAPDGRAHYDIDPESRKLVLQHLGLTVYWIKQLAQDLGVTLMYICIKNTEKLTSRMVRGTLRGNGDNR